MPNYYRESVEWYNMAVNDASDRRDATVQEIVRFAMIAAILDLSDRLEIIHTELGNIRRRLEAME